MLTKLSVKNYAIIDFIEINFSDKLNIITGETGAGKSILLGALAMVLGQRANTKALYNNTVKCVVEAQFNLSNYDLEAFFKINDLDYEADTIIRREINPAGKSRAFINDTPVTLDVLTQLSDKLVNLHSQHETLSLNSHSFQLQLVDALAAHGSLTTDYVSSYNTYIKLEKQLAQLKAIDDTGADLDYIEFQYKELEEADLSETEQDELENELSTLEHAEEIQSTLSEVSSALSESDQAITDQLSHISAMLNRIATYDSDINTLSERIESTLIEIQDIADEFGHKLNTINFEPERIEIINDRLNQLNRLQSKHRLSSCAQLISLRNELDEKLSRYDLMRGEIEEAEKEIKLKQQELSTLADKLSANRQAAIPLLQSEVEKRLAEVGMPNAIVSVLIESLPFEKINATGRDKINFLFTANKGAKPQPLKQVASGGELSRLMLVLKSLIAKHNNMPTLIFDEIDSGISGEVAYKVGALLEELGSTHQLICITHLPQIASKGDRHFYIYKGIENNRTHTQLKVLDENGRVEEIAKMLGGESLTDAAIANARELLLT